MELQTQIRITDTDTDTDRGLASGRQRMGAQQTLLASNFIISLLSFSALYYVLRTLPIRPEAMERQMDQPNANPNHQLRHPSRRMHLSR